MKDTLLPALAKAGVRIRTDYHLHGPFAGFHLRVEDTGRCLSDGQRMNLLRMAASEFKKQFPSAKPGQPKRNCNEEAFIAATKGHGVLWFTTSEAVAYKAGLTTARDIAIADQGPQLTSQENMAFSDIAARITAARDR